MGAWLGAGLHDFIVSLFHVWTYIVTALASALAAGLTAWHAGFGKGQQAGRLAEQHKMEREAYESHVRRGYYDLETPRPRSMGPPPPRPKGRRHYHD